MAKIDKDLIPVQALLIPKPILYTGKVLNWISPFLASRFAARLFLTPFKYKRPKREETMAVQSLKENVSIKKINREVIIYNYGVSNKKVLLVHGWSGSGTQLSMIADQLLNIGYSTVSFDAPAHGQSPGKRSNMIHFIETIYQLEKTHGPFHAAVGHSLGGMSLLRATKFGLGLQKLVIIGTANSITKITKDFAKNLQLGDKTGKLMKQYFDQHYGEDLDNYSGGISAEGIETPTLVIHDKNDVDVHYSSAIEIESKLKNGKIILTEKLGHRKILGDKSIIKKIAAFISES
ncbi:alpha/beta hydrolase [Aquimarina sp. MMG015]|uniref:alpha/beta fold hydrolase n=1 Tax=unclassified Aquimarina TaxID=2627091 RepID=UPI000E469749|nr:MULTISPECIES: alpha/beta hydrolase [unclassified Aquimarina]AXT55348.1 alpha/beta hydrolase [Aquimarina sp. AD1]MBQ4802317.1 alpha/beta hydrolase [Aquimarina sp. MMG015]RKN20597.1 alpha/beta fold hydrolase [Aquimarina sp. AD1]